MRPKIKSLTKIAWLLLTGTVCSLAHAQPQTVPLNQLWLSGGASSTRLYDPVFSPLLYRGTGGGLSLGYRRRSNTGKHTVVAGIMSQSLSPPAPGTGTITNNVLMLNYRYQRIVLTSKWRGYVGGGLHHFASFRSIQFLRDDAFVLDFLASVNVVVSADRRFRERHHIEASVAYPLLAYVVGQMRNPLDYPEAFFRAVADDPNNVPVGPLLTSGNFLSVDRLVDLTVGIRYRIDVSSQLGIGAEYAFRYYRYPKWQNIRYGMSQYFITGTYQF